MRQRRTGLLAFSLAALLLAVPACSQDANDSNSSTAAENKVEVFSWWAGPGEKEGLDALIADFKKKNSGIEFINAAVAGGAGTNAKSVLATRLQGNDPPDSYQVHA